MNTLSFDVLTRTSAGVSRRNFVMTLGAAGLAAFLAGPMAAEAKHKGGKKKKKQPQVSPPPVSPPAPDLCATQAEECTALLTNICNGNPDCQDTVQCCSFLGTCNPGAFVLCFSTSL